MEKPQESKKSRRRFLADMLFVGGGLSAAALLAKSQLGPPAPTHPPDIAGAVAVPDSLDRHPPMPGEPAPVQSPTPVKTCEPAIEGEVEPPALDGAVVMPENIEAPPPPKHSPAIKGKVAAPRPAPTPDSF